MTNDERNWNDKAQEKPKAVDALLSSFELRH
jgi:hypothetical protein